MTAQSTARARPGGPLSSSAFRRLYQALALSSFGDWLGFLATTALAEVRTRYSWPVLARSVDAVYAELRGTSPDLAWEAPSGVDPSCRFRAAAHLL